MFSDLFITALYTVFIQNIIFSGGYGISEALRAATKPRRFVLFSVMITFFAVATALISRTLDLIPAVNRLSATAHLVLCAAVLVFVFLGTVSLMVMTLHPPEKFLSTMGMAALNSLVLSAPFLNRQAGYSVAGSIGSGFGVGIAFAVAALLLGKGLERLSANKHIPEAFRGAPALFLYTSLISLAFSGFSGRAMFS